jgi:integrase
LVVFRRSSTRGLVGPTKSGKDRKVPLTGELERALKAVRHLRGKLVFCNEDGSPMKLDQLHERLWTACRRAGLREIRWHDLRHSFGSQLAIANVPVRQIQGWMGHSTIAMTMRYMHLAPGGGREFIAALESGPRAHGVPTESVSERKPLEN